MPPGPATIDLGVVSHDRPPEPAPPWPAPDWLRRLRHRLGGRGAGWVAAAAAGLALVLATATAATPSAPALARQFTVDNVNSIFAYQQHVYVVRDAPDGGGIVVAGYRLDTGELRWEAELPGRPDDTWLADVDGALLRYAGLGVQDESAGEVARLDGDSGALLWTHPGRALEVWALR